MSLTQIKPKGSIKKTHQTVHIFNLIDEISIREPRLQLHELLAFLALDILQHVTLQLHIMSYLS